MRNLLPLALLAACAAPSSVETLENPIAYPSSRTTVRRQADRVRADGSLEIELLVYGDLPNGHVGVRGSVDGAVWQDLAATPAGEAVQSRKRWLAVIPAGWKRVEYAAYADGMSGQAWDNNGGRNFIAEADAVVHRVSDTREGTTLHIDLDVRNLTYEKQCSAVITDSGWLTRSFINGSFVGPAERAGFERWRIDVALGNDPYPAYLHASAAVVEYAVSCSMSGQSYWDNDNASNYRSERTPQPDLIFATAFDGGADVAVSHDGTTYVLSGGRWLSAFAADGSWQFARELPENVGSIKWLDGAAILLAQYSSSSPRFAGISRAGSELWTLTGQLTSLVETPTAEYLIGNDGGARLGQTAPIVRTPDGGCSASSDPTGVLAFPIVSPGGVLYCTRPTGGIGRISLDGAPRAATLSLDGAPWAADDEGNLVVVSADHSSLIGYRATDAGVVEAWRKSDLTIAADTQYGQGATCPSHAVAAVGLYYNRPGSGPQSIVGFDLATGSERFRFEPPVYGGAPCARTDGAFYMDPGYERYGKSVIRITTDGVLGRPDLGMYGAVLAIRRNGQLLRREWSYEDTSGRIVLTDADAQELYSQTFSGGSPVQYRASVNGTHLSDLAPGQLIHYLFTP